MITLKNIFRLVRLLNLAFIVLTQLLFYYFIIIPIHNHFDSAGPVLSETLLFLIVSSTVLVAAAGYMINDYFDVGLDQINKPERVIVGRSISRRKIILIHSVLNIVGVLIGFYVAYVSGHFLLGFIPLLSSASLWFYSTRLKKTLLFGNLLVSFLTALVVLTVGWYELSAKGLPADLRSKMNTLMLLYAGFAFLVSLIREIIKDIEDRRGDFYHGAKTVPIVLGVKNSKWIIASLTITTMLLLGWQEILHYSSETFYAMLYLDIFVQLPLLFLIILLVNAHVKKQYHQISNLLKLVMLAGICSMPLIEEVIGVVNLF